MPMDEARMNAFVGKMLGDRGAAMTAALMLIGDKLGLCRERAKAPMTPAELASRSGTSARYVHEWLAAQAAAGHVEDNAEADRYSLSPEQSVRFRRATETPFNLVFEPRPWWDAVPSLRRAIPWRTP